MNLLDRYLQGDTVHVYEEIQKLGDKAFDPVHYPVIEAVLTETFRRVSYNLGIIYAELLKTGYCFKKEPVYDFEYPMLKPSSDVESLLLKLDAAVKPAGYVPLSLKLFYKIVGACNFAWDYDEMDEIPWEGADPIQIIPVTDLLPELEDLEEEDDLEALGVSADYLHKDNISGGQMYAIAITKKPQIDSQFLHEEHDTTFINYLRLTMENCGFSRAYAVVDQPDFIQFLKEVKPHLLKI